ncbi:MAG: methyltransferase domain-containing protein [Nitrospirae bacterium]|nr:methyltransferase domain-containing protein [Nitrospirota bacterium]
MKIHFVNDQARNTERPKLGLGYLSSYLKKYCPDIRISVSFQGDDIGADLKKIKPDIVGLTATTESFRGIISLGREIKKATGLPIIIGGPHITILPEHLPEWIDAGVIGEGEATLLKLLQNFMSRAVPDDKNIKGIIFREDGTLFRTGERELIHPLDQIPSPDWDMLGISDKGPGHILTSRGCTFKCVFCASASIWKKIRFFSPEYVVEEIRTVTERFGRKIILIYDDLFTANRERVHRISELIQEAGLNKSVTFECLANVNNFTPDVAESLKKMNVLRISFGMESGSPEILKYLKKGTVTHEKIRNAVKAGIDRGLEVLGSFILGSPGETAEDILKTHDFIRNVKLTETGINVATPFPGTELWDYAVNNGFIKEEWDDSLYAMQTITPQTIKDKTLLCSVDKDRFIELYKKLLDLDSTLQDRSKKIRTLKELVNEQLASVTGRPARILDVNCEDGTLGAAVKSVLNAEVTGLNPEEGYRDDAERRLEKVLNGFHELLPLFGKGYFDCIVFNDVPSLQGSVRRFLPFLREGGLIIGSFPNSRHLSYAMYSFLGIDRPPFETTNGTVQYLNWGIPDKGIYEGNRRTDIQSLLEGTCNENILFYELKGFSNDNSDKFSRLINSFGIDTTELRDGFEVIRYFFAGQKRAESEKAPEHSAVTQSPHNPAAHKQDAGQSTDGRPACPSGRDDQYYSQKRHELQVLVPEGPLKILDVGCGSGALGKSLLERGASEVTGIELDRQACEEAGRNLSRVICGNIEEIELEFEEGYFDCMIFGDILEHLKDPLSTLQKLAKYLKDSGVVIASIPNIRFFGIMHMLAEGRWEYADSGILDRTHLRFFTKKEMERLFEDAGFEISGMDVNLLHPDYYEACKSSSGDISFGRVTLRGLSADETRDLFVGQYLIRAVKAGAALREIEALAAPEDIQEAGRVLEEYLETHPVDIKALNKYADICIRLGDMERASESLDKILLFEPDNINAIDLKKRMVEGAGVDKN